MMASRDLGVLALLMLSTFAVAPALSWQDDTRKVRVSVVATDTSGGTLHYRWRATDGRIDNIDSPVSHWRLPGGPGLHFAHVLVSNGLGGYTERRVAVNTNSVDHDSDHDDDRLEEEQSRHHTRLVPPPAPSQQGDYYRGFIVQAYVSEVSHDAYAPDVLVYLQDANSTARFPPVGNVRTDAKGQFVIPGVPPGRYRVKCSADNGATYDDCVGGFADTVRMLDTATPNYFPLESSGSGIVWIGGTFTLADGKPCGVEDEFFGVHSQGTATLLDSNGGVVGGPVRVNEFGDFSIRYVPTASSLVLRCEHASPVPAPVTAAALAAGDGGKTTLTGVKAPVIVSMAAHLHGKSIGTFLPPPTGFASDVLTRADGYLTEKGIDSRLGACQYYKAVGAVEDCDLKGHFVGPRLTYEEWLREERLGKFAKKGVPLYRAAFINRADLNLARDHQSISYGPNQTAAVVCNHLGPPAPTPAALLNPKQSEIDRAVLNAVKGKNLVACVAMDYAAYPGVNDGRPFVRFLIFGPSGELLPSVDLDGRAEKFVPGNCVVCHGAEHYQGKFPEDGSGFANIGAHFLPYDVGNFEFARAHGLKESDQTESIYHLNQNVLQTGPTVAEMELIAGWYKNGHVLDKHYVPPSWQTLSKTETDFYSHVIARSCRGCHVAQLEGYNFDHQPNIAIPPASPLFEGPDVEFKRSVCGGNVALGLEPDFERDYMMPNSLVTFNRFWASSGSSDDQVVYFNNYQSLVSGGGQDEICGTTPYTP